MRIRTWIITLAVIVGMLALSAADAVAAPRPSYAPHIKKHIVSLSGKSLGSHLTTWYGPGFYGNRTACGKTLRQNTWGIAHRTLPCGTLVNILYKGRKVSVRVIDRGPYSGATVDLTARTKQYLRFTSGRVTMAKIYRYKVVR